MKNETIVDRVVERLKEQPLGDLITEEDLHDIVKQAIPKVFFEPRIVIEGSGYHEQRKTYDPVIVTVMRDLLKDAAATAVQKWIEDNQQLLADQWQKVFDEGLSTYVQQHRDMKLTQHIQQALSPSFQRLNEERSRQGLPPIW